MAGELLSKPENRVELTSEVDRLGMRRLGIHYDFGEAERETLARGLEIFARTLGASLRGRVRILWREDAGWPSQIPGYHHMGTTRMHEDPKRGVVDPQCRVHGIANLFVAGSSVFPTSGRANPTYTLLALALRLADRLAEDRGA